MCKVNCACLCKCEKEEMDSKTFAELHHLMREQNPRLRNEKLAEAEQRLLEFINEKKKYNKPSQERIDALVRDAVKKRRFINAQNRMNGKKWGSSHI